MLNLCYLHLEKEKEKKPWRNHFFLCSFLGYFNLAVSYVTYTGFTQNTESL